MQEGRIGCWGTDGTLNNNIKKRYRSRIKSMNTVIL